MSKYIRCIHGGHVGAVPEKEVQTTGMYRLHCLAHVYKPDFLLIPKDVVLRQVSMDKVADSVELLHHLHHLGVGRHHHRQAHPPTAKDLLRYLLAREGVYATCGPALLAHTKQKVSNIVDLTVLRLAFFMGYE